MKWDLTHSPVDPTPPHVGVYIEGMPALHPGLGLFEDPGRWNETYQSPQRVISRTKFCAVKNSAMLHVVDRKLAEGLPQSDKSIEEVEFA